jgi:cytochrome c
MAAYWPFGPPAQQFLQRLLSHLPDSLAKAFNPYGKTRLTQGMSPVKHCTAMAASAALVFGILAIPAASQAATPEEAKALSERAAGYVKQAGEEKAFADFTRADGGFVQGELYVFCYDHDGVNKAHGGNPSFVGKNLLHIKDPDGKEPNAEIVKVGFEQGQCWVDFKWPNPATKKIQPKSAYVIHTNDVVCGVGYYKE